MLVSGEEISTIDVFELFCLCEEAAAFVCVVACLILDPGNPSNEGTD